MNRRSPKLALSTFVVLTSWVASPSAGAIEGDETKAEKHKLAAFRAINHGDLETGLAELEEAYRAYPHPNFLFNIAVVEEQRPNNCPAAHAAYLRFFKKCESCESEGLAQSRFARLEGRCLVPVRLSTEPPGARVYIDGEEQTGTTPLALRLWAGRHSVVAERDGYERTERPVVVLEGTPSDIELALPAIEAPGRLRLTNLPSGARAMVDGEVVGEGEVELPAGVHAVELTLRDGRTFTVYRNLLPGEVATVDAGVEANGAPFGAAVAPVKRGPATWPFWTSLGVTAVSAGVGVGLGIAATSKADEVNGDEDLRPDLRVEQGDEAEAMATGANVAFAVAGVGAATTVLVWLWPSITGKGPPLFFSRPPARASAGAGLGLRF